jgi:hypothetical protein
MPKHIFFENETPHLKVKVGSGDEQFTLSPGSKRELTVKGYATDTGGRWSYKLEMGGRTCHVSLNFRGLQQRNKIGVGVTWEEANANQDDHNYQWRRYYFMAGVTDDMSSPVHYTIDYRILGDEQAYIILRKLPVAEDALRMQITDAKEKVAHIERVELAPARERVADLEAQLQVMSRQFSFREY